MQNKSKKEKKILPKSFEYTTSIKINEVEKNLAKIESQRTLNQIWNIKRSYTILHLNLFISTRENAFFVL